MIFKASQRGHAAELAVHLMNGHGNEHVEVHRVDGFVGQSVGEALSEVETIAKGTKCIQPLFSVSLNPPDYAKVSVRVFEDTVKRIEKQFGLVGQPHVMMFHEKQGRRHCHCVWSRIDADRMRAINLPYFKNRLMEMGKAIYLEQGWELPKGFIDRAQSNPLNFDLQDWHQAKRQKRSPQEIKQILQRCWRDSTDKATFEQAIEQHGFYLACGNPRRGFVVVDWSGKVRSLSRQTSVKAKELSQKLREAEALPLVEAVLAKLQVQRFQKLKALAQKLHEQHKNRLAPFMQQKADMTKAHQKARASLRSQHKQNLLKTTQKAQKNLTKGLRGFWEKLTGQSQRKQELIALEIRQEKDRHSAELDAMRHEQLAEAKALQVSIETVCQTFESERQSLITSVLSQAEKSQRPELEQALAQNFQSLSRDLG